GTTIGNSYPTLTLTGVGTSMTSSPATPSTPTRPGEPTTHATKPTGTVRPFDLAESVTCKTVTKSKGHPAHRVKVQQCTARRITGSLTFTAKAATARVTISRGALVYASGTGTSRGIHRWQLLIQRRRALRPGTYTLTLRTGRVTQRASLRVT